MSCELIDLSERGDGVDLEALRESVVALQPCISEIAARYDGFVVNRQGNTLLVLFGYPVAHEHNAERAVRAGLELCAAVGAARPGADVSAGCEMYWNSISASLVLPGSRSFLCRWRSLRNTRRPSPPSRVNERTRC
jgi:hypothetical protein